MCEHPIADVWNDLGLQVVEYLDSVNVTWTTIDPVRFTEAEKDAGPVFLWVDVKPGSLSPARTPRSRPSVARNFSRSLGSSTTLQ